MTNPTSPPVTAEQIEAGVNFWATVDYTTLIEDDVRNLYLAMLKAHKPAVVGDAVERIERRLTATALMFHKEGALFADRDGEWTLPQLRDDVRAALTTPVGDEVVERLKTAFEEIVEEAKYYEQPALRKIHRIARAAINSLGLGIGQ